MQRWIAWLCLTLGLGAGVSVAVETQGFDLVIANGRVIDPDTRLDAIRNIGITNGSITAISTASLIGRRTIDATGLVVAPGFIDMHAHGQIPETYRLEAADGVTTALELEVGTADITRWYDERRDGRLINYGVSVGHIPVRMAVMRDPGIFLPSGDAAHRAATPGELREIVSGLERGLNAGAVDMGAGFVYTPAASRQELLDVFRVASRANVPVHVHIRRGAPGLEQALALATEAKSPLHVVHINSVGRTDTPRMLAMIAEAQSRGLDVTAEAYPYDAGMTEITSANLDEYVGATNEKLRELEWPRTGERLNQDSFAAYRKTGGPVVLHTNTEAMVAVAIDSPLTMIASDAYWENGVGHPRTAGTYSRVLGRYVAGNATRPDATLSLMDALAKMTIMPARRLESRVPAMKLKGRVQQGADADLTMFDPAKIIDRSTYREPALPPAGIAHVLVRGVPVVENGTVVSGVSPGRAVRAPIVR